MQTITLATQFIFAGGVCCAVIFSLKRDWLKAATWVCLTTYLMLDRVMPPEASPPVLINSVLVIFLALVGYQIFKRKKPTR
ncbi:hypothetical protein [Collimonas pratensis]|uniref:Membrane protein n=1 Tax=Collimonas pratensis TaxID=279113 RepID=A0ABN4M9P7_9BURK|nr:hypothetical protein [Collimonas pratensis]AMP13913.1 putative membrane protein [Collimonas pratensis]NKI68513.1 hypothetical protein [Collimonas pratensis]